jgi:DNA helicase-2/ATP-dependent DNA helicase PcrA
MEEALRKKGIDYRIYGGISFYGRKEVKDLLAYFRLTINPNDEEAFKRVINYPKRGIGATSINKFIVAANENKMSLWEMAGNLQQSTAKINSTTKTKIENFRTMVESFAAQLKKVNAYELANIIFKQTGTSADLQSDSSIEGLGRVENIEELLNAIKDFTDKIEEAKKEKKAIAQEKITDDLASFMEDVALMTDSDQKEDKNSDKVSLMTIHAAKGLEFPVVYTVGLEENLFPSFMSLNSREEIEEERRLFYVALTRAMQKAYLSYAEMRYKWGELKMSEPSRFLEEVDEKYLEYDEARRPMKSVEQIVNQPKVRTQIKRRLKKVSEDNRIFQAKEKGSSSGDIRVGMSVKHAKFGTGKVLQVEGSGANQKLSVQFPAVGTKNLLLRFAKLEIV